VDAEIVPWGVLESAHADGVAVRPYRFYFYSHEPNEPAHIHVDRDDLSAKFWLDPAQLAANFGFRAHELRELQLMVVEHRKQFLEAWHGFFGGGR
jgi:hypothetical protein